MTLHKVRSKGKGCIKCEGSLSINQVKDKTITLQCGWCENIYKVKNRSSLFYKPFKKFKAV